MEESFVLKLYNHDKIAKKICNQLFLMIWESGQCVVRITGKKEQYTAITYGIVRQSKYKTINLPNQCKYQFIVKWKAIKYKVNVIYYLSFY